VTKDLEKAEIFKALFPLFFIGKVSPQASQNSMPSGKVWRGRLLLLRKVELGPLWQMTCWQVLRAGQEVLVKVLRKLT